MAFRKMGGFGGQGGGFRSHGARPPFRRDDGFGGPPGEKRSFSAICADCGSSCEVPFRPNGKKPVYCKTCLPKHMNSERGEWNASRHDAPRRFERRDNAAPMRSAPDARIDTLQRDVASVHAKLDTLTKLVEKLAAPAPTSVTPEPVATSMPAKKRATAAKAAKKRKK